MGGDGTRAKGRGRRRALAPRARPVARRRATGTPAQNPRFKFERRSARPSRPRDGNHWQTVFRQTRGMPDEYNVTLRQADQARSDFAALADDLDFIKEQLARLPTRKDQARTAARRRRAHNRFHAELLAWTEKGAPSRAADPRFLRLTFATWKPLISLARGSVAKTLVFATTGRGQLGGMSAERGSRWLFKAGE